MMKKMNRVFTITLQTGLALLAGVSAQASSIQFTVDYDGVKLYEVGKDAKQKKFEEIAAPWKIEINKNESRLFVFEKPGFIPVYVPVYFEPSGDVSFHIDLKKLDGEMKTQMSTPALALADELVDEVIFTQHMIDEKKYSEALVKAEALYMKHPQSTSVKLLYANTLLTNKQFQKADSIYAAALAEIPDGKDSLKKTIETLRNRLGKNRTPAQEVKK